MTNSKQHFSWNDYGLSLYIPENSLPVNLQQCSIHITTSIMGDYQLPHDTHLVSTVFWIECVPKCHFSQPLVLEIEHCAKPENVSKLQFIKAGLKEENIVFHPISNPFETKFSKKNSSGLIQLNSFSGYGVAQRGCKERRYLASVYYCEENKKRHQIHFAISWNTKAHIKVNINNCYLIIINNNYYSTWYYS